MTPPETTGLRHSISVSCVSGKLAAVRWRSKAVRLAAIVGVWLVPLFARGQAAHKSYRPPRTAWGDPDLQGNYTNKNEQSTPLERPDEFTGRRLDDVSGGELAAVLAKREQQVLA